MGTVKLRSKLETTDTRPPWHILRIPKSKVASFGFKGNLRRVVCTLNGTEKFNCSLFPSQGDYFITLSKKLRDKLGIEPGDSVSVELEKDTSKFGMPMPKEFAEVLRQDSEGERHFNALSPGNQRLMLKLIVMVKGIDKRIDRSLTGVELLKRADGKFDYHAQYTAMKAVTSPRNEGLHTGTETEFE
ncbi:MAG: YdeI/OmpD-associated family protein [Pyrinomonadaceae bacterium]